MIQRAVILSTGDELTTGRTVDTNASYISDRLVAAGVDVVSVIVVGDYPERIAWAWREGMRLAELVVSTGGLGPTADDLTTETLAGVLGRNLVSDESVARRIRQVFEAMGRTMPENNLKQAQFPAGAVILVNPLGTAPGYRVEYDSEWGRRWLAVMPGVPREMKPMLENELMPWVESVRGSDEKYLSHTFQTFGISESALDELVAGAVPENEGRIAFRAAFPQISVRVTVRGAPAHAAELLETNAARLRERLGEYCYGEGDTTMEAAVGAALVQRGATIGVAESCTGGLIAHRLTNVPGSSRYFASSVGAYSNEIKHRVLGVRRETLDAHGAVSVETAAEMAEGVRRLTGATYGLATTGIAGPDGGTADKPVGTVCIALASPEKTYVHRYQLWGNREWVKLLTSQVALDWVRRSCQGGDPTQSRILRR